MSSEYLESLRAIELECVLSEIKRYKPDAKQILEIGAGAGWQSKILSENGYVVKAIDLQDGLFTQKRVWPIVEYDGMNIPFPDGSFDVVYSSSVLEHIEQSELFQKEIHRVLKKDGISVHMLPSAAWRFWTSVAYYLVVGRSVASTKWTWSSLRRLVTLPPRHGENGTALSELFSFSRLGWSRLMARCGWEIMETSTNGLFYTGYELMGPSLSIASRRRMGVLLGDACWLFVIRKAAGPENCLPPRFPPENKSG